MLFALIKKKLYEKKKDQGQGELLSADDVSPALKPFPWMFLTQQQSRPSGQTESGRILFFTLNSLSFSLFQNICLPRGNSFLVSGGFSFLFVGT